MGKKSKLFKVGNSKKNFGDVIKIKKEKIKHLMNISKKMNLIQESGKFNKKADDEEASSDYSDVEKANSSKLNKTNLNTTVANYDRKNLYDTLIDLNATTDRPNLTQLNETFLNYAKQNNLNRTKLHQTIADFAMKPGDTPLRNRRVKTSSVLSKGQRKRLEKKEKVLKKKLLDEVLRKNKSLIINNKSTINKTNLNATNFNADANIKSDLVENGMIIESATRKNVNNTVAINNINGNSKISSQNQIQNKKAEFDLMEMNNTLTNMLKDIKEQDENIQVEKNMNDLKKRKKHNIKKLL